MAEQLVKWGTILLFLAVGISFFSAIWVSWLPVMIHWIIGSFFLLIGGYLAYKEVK